MDKTTLRNWEKLHHITTPTTNESLKAYKANIREIIELRKQQESLLKNSITKQKAVLKYDTRLLHKTTRERLNYEMILKKLPIRFSARVSDHRRWAKEHPIEAFNRSLEAQGKKE